MFLIDARKIPEAYYGISLCLLAMNRFPEAKQYFKQGNKKSMHSVGYRAMCPLFIGTELLPFFAHIPSENGEKLKAVFEAPDKLVEILSIAHASSAPPNQINVQEVRRIELITKHRENIRKFSGILLHTVTSLTAYVNKIM